MNFLVRAGLALLFTISAPAGDWRSDLLKEKGLGAKREEWKQSMEGFKLEPEDMQSAYERLGSSSYPEREQAQSKLLKVGIQAQFWLRAQPRSADPEVRIRVTEILDLLEFPSEGGRERMIRHALTSLLAEPEGNPSPSTGGIFYEWFGSEMDDLDAGYRQFKFEAERGMVGKVADGQLVLNGNRDGDGDQRLVLRADAWPGGESFSKDFSVSAKLGGEQGGEGVWHLGIAIGKVRVLYHPGYRGGGFRVEQVGTTTTVIRNQDMGFTPSTDEMQRMRVKVRQLNHGDVELGVSIEQEGEERFERMVKVAAEMIGKVDQISLDRSGRSGGDARFSEFIIDASD